MLGYYTALQEQNKALSDIPLGNLSYAYLEELGRRADKETRHLVDHMKNIKRKNLTGGKRVDK